MTHRESISKCAVPGPVQAHRSPHACHTQTLPGISQLQAHDARTARLDKKTGAVCACMRCCASRHKNAAAVSDSDGCIDALHTRPTPPITHAECSSIHDASKTSHRAPNMVAGQCHPPVNCSAIRPDTRHQHGAHNMRTFAYTPRGPEICACPST